MVIKGFQKISLIDYPGKAAAVVFVGGCNFRCPYCYNRDLVLCPERLPTISEAEVLKYLEKRKGLLDGVVITGGEPTLQEDLLEFIDKIDKTSHPPSLSLFAKVTRDKQLRRAGVRYFVKLDTNGANTTALHSAVVNDLVDYVALDIKAPLDERYAQAVGFPRRGYPLTGVTPQKAVVATLRFLCGSGVDFELRTTVVPGLHSEEDLLDLAKQLREILTSHLSPLTSPLWFLQNFRAKNCLDPRFEKIKPYDKMFFENLIPKLKVYMPRVSFRS